MFSFPPSAFPCPCAVWGYPLRLQRYDIARPISSFHCVVMCVVFPIPMSDSMIISHFRASKPQPSEGIMQFRERSNKVPLAEQQNSIGGTMKSPGWNNALPSGEQHASELHVRFGSVTNISIPSRQSPTFARRKLSFCSAKGHELEYN